MIRPQSTWTCNSVSSNFSLALEAVRLGPVKRGSMPKGESTMRKARGVAIVSSDGEAPPLGAVGPRRAHILYRGLAPGQHRSTPPGHIRRPQLEAPMFFGPLNLPSMFLSLAQPRPESSSFILMIEVLEGGPRVKLLHLQFLLHLPPVPVLAAAGKGPHGLKVLKSHLCCCRFCCFQMRRGVGR